MKISCPSVMVTVSYPRRTALTSAARRSPSSTGSRSPLALAAILAVTISGGKAATAEIWRPTGQMQWQWVLQTSVDTSVNVPVFDIDGFDNNASVVTTLHANGARVICYISAGTYENWRPDASSFPSSVLGSSNGWPGEQWLDVRQISILGPIMLARMQMCARKGFDAIKPNSL